MNALNNKTLKCKAKTKRTGGEIDEPISIVGDFNTSVSDLQIQQAENQLDYNQNRTVTSINWI